jgi:hypothetical protein
MAQTPATLARRCSGMALQVHSSAHARIITGRLRRAQDLLSKSSSCCNASTVRMPSAFTDTRHAQAHTCMGTRRRPRPPTVASAAAAAAAAAAAGMLRARECGRRSERARTLGKLSRFVQVQAAENPGATGVPTNTHKHTHTHTLSLTVAITVIHVQLRICTQPPRRSGQDQSSSLAHS